MRSILVLYATREGQSRRVAEHVAARLGRQRFAVRLVDAAALHEPFALADYGAAVLVAPVHLSSHPREMLAFISAQHAALQRMPALFLSLSLSQAGAQDASASAEQRAKAAADVQSLIDRFCKATGWAPGRVVPVAGALAYSRYGFLKRMIMKRIARQAGGSTDTSRDHVYTDFEKLDQIVDDFSQPLVAAPLSAARY